MRMTTFIPEEKQMSTTEANKATFRRFIDAANSGDPALLSKTIDELVEPSAVVRTPVPLDVTGARALKEVFATLHRAFP